MANTKKYLSHLLQNTGITPACSEEERAAADVIAKIFSNHGFTPEMQEFSASGMAKVVQGVLGVAVFIGAVLMGIGGPAGIAGLVITLVAAVLFVLERSGRPVLSGLGSGGLSQNVIAYHKASGPLASPRNRPVVVVAHYDSPREDLLCRESFAAYKPIITKLLPYAMVAPAVIAIVRLLPVPDAAKVVLWVIAILVALIPLVNGVAIIANRFVLPYTTGSVSNKSSVAAMLGVMDAVAPYELGDEFPRDVPADEYFAEQQRILDEAIAAAEAAAAAEAEAAMSYPHELEAQDGADEVEGEMEDAPSADFEVIEGTATDLSSVDLEATGMISDAESEAGATIVTEPIDDQVLNIAEAEEPVLDAGATITTLPVIEDQQADYEVPAAAVEDVHVEQLENHDEDLGVQGSLDLDAAAPEPKLPFYVNAEGNVRFGTEVIRGLGMLPADCAVVYEAGDEPEPEQPTAFEVEHEDPYMDQGVADYPAFDVDEDALSDVEADEGFECVEESEEELPFEDSPMDEAYELAAETAAEPELIDAIEVDEGFDDIMEAEYEVIEDEDDAVTAEERNVDAPATESPAETGDEADEAPAADDGREDAVEESDGSSVPSAEDAAETGANEEADVKVDPFGSTAVFRPEQVEPVEAPADLSGTIAMPRPAAPKVETVDSLMAEITQPAPARPQPAPARPQRAISVPSTLEAPVPHTPQAANRASLFDLPDPSATPVDPFAVPNVPAVSEQQPQVDAGAQAREPFTVVSAAEPAAVPAVEDRFETIKASAPVEEKPRRGVGRFFGRKKKNDDSMSEWLGVDDSFDAKTSGHDIGSWDNFEDDWKGGAAGYDGATEEELREAITSMGDDELLGHDIWFVATGASENGNAGIQAFLDAHRDKLRGVFLINLESVGAGQLAMLATEGEDRVLKGDKRIMKLVRQVSSDFHRECATVDMPYVTTDAHVAMGMSLRSLTVAGVEGTGFALSHTEEDQPYNIDTDNVAFVSDVVAEVIRRS